MGDILQIILGQYLVEGGPSRSHLSAPFFYRGTGVAFVIMMPVLLSLPLPPRFNTGLPPNKSIIIATSATTVCVVSGNGR